MKTARKVLIIALCAVLLVSASVMGTLAYLTATTNAVTNTFTVGNVTIDDEKGLDEAKVDVYGKPVEGADRVTENTYKLLPGKNYTKDPTVHITKGSEPCYLFVKVVNPIAAIEAETTIENQILAKWTKIADAADGGVIYYYNAIVDARDAQQDVVVFEKFTLKTDADVAKYDAAKITVQAYAVQQEGFSSAADAWAKAPLEAWTKTA